MVFVEYSLSLTVENAITIICFGESPFQRIIADRGIFLDQFWIWRLVGVDAEKFLTLEHIIILILIITRRWVLVDQSRHPGKSGRSPWRLIIEFVTTCHEIKVHIILIFQFSLGKHVSQISLILWLLFNDLDAASNNTLLFLHGRFWTSRKINRNCFGM